MTNRVYRALLAMAKESRRRSRYYARTPSGDDRLAPRDPRLAPTRLLGANLDSLSGDLERRLFPAANPGLRVLKAPYEIGRAFVEDPGSTSVNTLKGARDTLVGLPSAAVKSVTDPKGALEGYVKDLERRYGPLLKGDERAFRERIKREGFTAEALDAAAVAAVQGRALGAGLKTTKRGRRYMQGERPRLRQSGGRARRQRVSSNAFLVGFQQLEDQYRRLAHRRRVERAEKAGGRVRPVDRSLGPGEVAPVFPRLERRSQRRQVAQRKSRGVQALKGEQAREVRRGASRNIARLSRAERRAFKYAMQLGIRSPEAAARHLRKRRADIVAARKREGTEIPKTLRKTNDELRGIDWLLANPNAFTERLARVVEGERGREIRVARRDPGLAAGQRLLRRYAPAAEHLGVKRRDGESATAFVKRVQRATEKEGLARPAYFPSEKRPTIRYSDYALGGTRAAADDKRYTGALFRTGREDARAEVFAEGVARSIKRRHNWRTVADNFNDHSYRWGRNKTIGELLDELDRRGIDPGEVAFWNPRKYRLARNQFEKDGRDLPDVEEPGSPAEAGLHEAVQESAIDVKRLAGKGGEWRNTSGWSVLPKAVYDEIHMDTRPSGAAARSWDVVKGKQSRILLGTNPPWLAFQGASNVLLTALAKTGPIDAVKAQVWWRKLDPELRAEVEPYVGVGPFVVDVQQTKLGAATNARLVNSYRAFKATPLMRRAGKANPLDLLFRADNAQNNFFRRAVLYSQAKRDGYRRLGQDISKVAEAQERIKGLFTLGPRDQLVRVIRDREAIEQHAEYVNRMLGDYATYTAKERRTLARGIMFYGFLRFSLHFTFWTMPTKHPVVTAIVGNLGRLQTEEVRELLGGDELPFALGRLYLTKDGELQAVDLSRANPAANALTELVAPYDGGIQFVPRRAIGLLPPMIGAALDMAYGKSAFTNRPLRVRGEHAYAAAEREQSGAEIRLEDRGRIAAERFLDLFYPYRVAEAVEFGTTPQGDDSLLWDPRPTRYKDEEIRRSLAQEKRRHGARGTGDVLLEELTPFLPHRTRDPQIAESIRERRGDRVRPKPKGVRGDFEEFKRRQQSGGVRQEFERFLERQR